MTFRSGGSSLDGFDSAVGGELGFALGPKGLVVCPRTGHVVASEGYGPSLLEINREDRLVRRYAVPATPSASARTAASRAW